MQGQISDYGGKYGMNGCTELLAVSWNDSQDIHGL
jgi:hypothetical protein